MLVNEAREVLENQEPDDTKMRPNQMYLGMGLIMMSLNNADVETDWCSNIDGTLYYGDFEASVKNMDKRQVRTMARLGWEEQEACWSYYIG